MHNHTIEPILLSEMEGPKIWFTHLMNLDKKARFCACVFYIRGPKENIIVDCGGVAENVESPMPGFVTRDIRSPGDGLKKIGLSYSDIDIVIITHLHPDHIELAHEYKNARFIIQKDELEFGLNPHESFKFAYIKDYYKDLNFNIIEGDKEIVGGVSVLLTPGHSPGGQSVMIETKKGKAIITGFCCIRENLEPPEEVRKIMPIIMPSVMTNATQLYDSIKRVKELADIVIPIHAEDIAGRKEIP